MRTAFIYLLKTTRSTPEPHGVPTTENATPCKNPCPAQASPSAQSQDYGSSTTGARKQEDPEVSNTLELYQHQQWHFPFQGLICHVVSPPEDLFSLPAPTRLIRNRSFLSECRGTNMCAFVSSRPGSPTREKKSWKPPGKHSWFGTWPRISEVRETECEIRALSA